MSLVLVDSGAWLAIADRDDPKHRTALDFYRGLKPGSRLVTTDYVLSETYTWLRYRVGHRAALAVHGLVVASEQVGTLRVEWIDPERHDSGWRIFQRYADQVLSFADCTSAVVAREIGADYVFSFDSDFSKLGFDVRPGP